MSFSTFSSFLQKLAFQRSKSQLKSLPFVSAFDFSAFRLEKLAEKQKQTGPKNISDHVPLLWEDGLDENVGLILTMGIGW
jgi:hypothetical protein